MQLNLFLPDFFIVIIIIKYYYDIISLGIQCPANVGCFCYWNGSPQLTLALCPTAWSHSRFVPQCAGDENGCPLRNSRNFHLALPASVGVHETGGRGVYVRFGFVAEVF